MRTFSRTAVAMFSILLITAFIFCFAACDSEETYTLTINYIADGATYATKTISSDSEDPTPEQPAAADGMTFVGWFEDQAFTVPFDYAARFSSLTQNETVDVYALFEPSGGTTDEPALLSFSLQGESYAVTGFGADGVGTTDVVIPATYNDLPVTAIADGAFSFSDIESVTIASSVTSIGTRAFGNCASLTSIAIPGSVATVGDHAFIGCSSLSSVTIESGVASIGANAFENCTALASLTVPDSVTEIGASAFLGCTSLARASLGSGLTSLGESAFRNCTSLASIDLPSSLTSLSDFTFAYCALTSIEIPSSVTSIGSKVFSSCGALRSISIPFVGQAADGSGATCFGYLFGADDADDNSALIPSSLQSVTVTGGSSVADYAFFGCSRITSITLPDGVASIGAHAFDGCSSLGSLSLPDTVLTIGDYALSGCTALTEFYVPVSVTDIGSYALRGCTSVASLTIPFVGSRADGSGETCIGYLFGASDYFYNHNFVPASLTDVTIVGSAAIDDFAFYNCANIRSISVTAAQTAIGEGAFYNCSRLVEFTLAAGINEIGNEAFFGCTSLSDVNFLGELADWIDFAGAVTGSYSNPMTIATRLSIGGSLLTEAVVPDGVTGLTGAFFNCASLVSVTLPASIESIGSLVFSGCTSLTEIVYLGTMEQWQAVSLASGWASSTSGLVVTCTDGTIAV